MPALVNSSVGSFDGTSEDRKSTRLNSSHVSISYAVFCLKKKRTIIDSSEFLFPRPPPPLSSPLFPYTTLFRSDLVEIVVLAAGAHALLRRRRALVAAGLGAGEHVLELHHAGVGEQQRRVVRRHQRRSEEHTSELQSRFDIVCRLLLEKKKNDHR